MAESESTQPGLGTDPEYSANGSEDEVEVTFSHTDALPYRRKSSLVHSDMRPLTIRPLRSTECIVHQFLESQRRATMATAANARQPSSRLSRLTEPESEPTSGHSEMPESQERQKMELPLRPAELQDGTTANTNSRLLTKRQLGEIAWNVRELGRRLGNMRLRINVRTIFLLVKLLDRQVVVQSREMIRWLMDERARGVRYTIYIQRELRQNPYFDDSGLLEEIRAARGSNDTSHEQEHNQEEQTKSEEPQPKTQADGGSDSLHRRLRTWHEDVARARPHAFDIVISLGGDGTVLYASWLFQGIVPPVMSFSLGSLGFLTKFDFDRYQELLSAAFTGGVTVSLRLRFEGTIMRSSLRPSGQNWDDQYVVSENPPITRSYETAHDLSSNLDVQQHCSDFRDLIEELIGEEKDDERTHWPDGTFTILNEIVVDRGPNPTLSTLELFADDEHLTSMAADGVCVSTPTGSTAYNLAAGGSLCHPENPVMLVTAICAHTLSSRPIVLPDAAVLRVGVPYDARTSSWASFDGQERVRLDPGDYITVSASRYPFAAVRASPHGDLRLGGNDDWVTSISKKLGWNTRQRQKAFT